MNSNVLWRAVGNGDISNPKGNILYTSNSLSNLYNPSMADTYVASNSIDVNSDSPKLANSLVNPDDSTGPKYPSGLSESNLNIKATRTIEYVDNNGKTLKSPVVQTVEYKRNAIVNFSDVNNPTVSYGSWMPADSNIDSYPAVTDLQIDGYVTNQKAVSSAKPSSNSENITVQVKYIPNKVTVDNVIKEGTPVDSNNPTGPKYPSGLSESDLNSTSTRTIEYVDNNGKTLKSPVVQTVEYKRNAIVNFSDVNNPTVSYGSWMPADSNIDSYPAVTDLQIDGYVTNQKAVSSAKPFSNSENITVQVKYIPNKVTVDNVIKEGTPVDSNNPTGPKYPSGLSESDLNSTSTRTIEYVDNNGKTLKSPVVQTVEYKRNAIVDFSDVNNPTVSYGSWMPADGNIDSYPAVTSPQIDGYSSNIGVVNSKVSKFDDGNLKITVVYTPIINSFYNERIDIYAYHFRGYTKPNTVKFYDDSNLVQFNNNLNSYKSENGSPMFKVLEKVHNSNGSTSYKVQMISKYTGRLSSKIAYLLSEDINKVLPLYYTNENRPNRIKVIGSLVCGYKNANLTGRKNIYNQGKILYVSSIVKDGLVYRLQLTNGEYITANRLYVSEVK
ncbi:mucin-binding protein [Apilactobacillus ozensis]|uniref:mucin-binding protein n=1 Tax=Apilactobacillus ozensis TaxID=866801 RepID=UPI0006CFB47D|nr:DUF5776 domain-containing protein [Apilactobacillus ozensis]